MKYQGSTIDLNFFFHFESVKFVLATKVNLERWPEEGRREGLSRGGQSRVEEGRTKETEAPECSEMEGDNSSALECMGNIHYFHI